MSLIVTQREIDFGTWTSCTVMTQLIASWSLSASEPRQQDR